MKFFFVLSFTCILAVGCNPSTNLHPDDVLLEEAKNVRGERPIDFDAIVNAPAKEPYRIQEVERLEDLVEGLQTARLETREAVYIGSRSEPLVNGPSAFSVREGQVIAPRERLQIFWPTDIVNDYIKVKNKSNKASWLKYKDSKSAVQVVLLEDFVIPQVSISDSKLIVINSETVDAEPTLIEISEEEIKEITYVLEESEEVEKSKTEPQIDLGDEVKKAEVSVRPEIETVEVDLNPSTTEPVQSGLAPATSLRPQARPVRDDSSHVDVDVELDLEEPKDVTEEEQSEFAPMTSVRPVLRPANLDTSKPPLLNAAGLNSEQLLDVLGIVPVKVVSNESTYLSNGRSNIAEVFPRAHKTFSACTFDPAQGSEKSKCYRELVLSSEFTDFIADEGLSCANQAAKLVFNATPAKVMFRTNGGSVNRGSSRSLHDRGRALDVFKVFLYFQKDAGPKEIVFHKNNTDGSSASERRNYNFYWEFENCWTKKIQDYHKTKSCGSTGSGALTYRYNSAHSDHMHISLPVCRDVRNRFNLYGT